MLIGSLVKATVELQGLELDPGGWTGIVTC